MYDYKSEESVVDKTLLDFHHRNISNSDETWVSNGRENIKTDIKRRVKPYQK
ncbi:hypothetical protein LGK95_18290 [Clostridium algoriphilum]|uniref:hypothetical protein n=1 Tax=Clostridium algoriphilum TaxID=198347 RepID=UPI001CF4F912|nr:hypothetical protein [Clostridium algoriphilum]MCB2295435.1 hypothetical protein [Clostridium algoriphilum]